MGKKEMEQFLAHLAIDKKVASSTQNQAFNAVLSLYEKVLNISLKDQNISAMRAKRKEHVPVVLTIDEVQQIIYYMNGIYRLMLQLLYGCGLSILPSLVKTILYSKPFVISLNLSIFLIYHPNSYSSYYQKLW